MQKIPISGGPHSGKTTLMEALKGEFPDAYFVEEPATRVINRETERQQVNPAYTPVVPWEDFRIWVPVVLEESRVLEAAVPKDAGLVFLDRSLIDNIGYCRMNNVEGFLPEVDRRVRMAHYAFALFCEPIGDYTATFERRETAEEAKLTHDFLAEAYHESGLEIVHLTAVPVPERVEIVRAAINK